MKGKLFLYLFVFTLLFVVFQYVNSKSILETYEKKTEKALEKVQDYKDSIMALEDENLNLLYFNLENNDEALSYFERDGYDTSELIPFIKDELYKLNDYKGDDHPIVPYASMTEGKILINKVRLLNHKWIIADFSDGKFWGEMFLTYEITDNKELKFKLVEFFMYPPQTN
ncbi:MAG: hydrolase [Flavobacteriaceae bacterium]|nr:hydrolase [Flavobacteriaceae bacterium]